MNTIIINENDIERIGDYENAHYFENFVFNDFKLIVKHEEYKVIYNIHINKNVNEVNYRMIANGTYKDCKFIFTEDERGWEYIEKPNGELIDDYIEALCKAKKSDDEIVESLSRAYSLEIDFIILVKQYIMNESYKRSVIQKESTKQVKTEVSDSNKNTTKQKTSAQYLLKSIIEYISCNRRKFNITCECWNVRGHFRHYKNGKVTWVTPYEKGKKRNSSVDTHNKVYKIG